MSSVEFLYELGVAIQQNPLLDFAHRCYDSGITEDGLDKLLAKATTVSDADKIRLRNYFRDLKRRLK